MLVSLYLCGKKFTFCDEAVMIIFVILQDTEKGKMCNITSYDIPAHLLVLVICVFD